MFAAVHEKTGEPVAVKLIAQHIADEPRFRARFDYEIKTLQRLRHKGIVRLIGFGLAGPKSPGITRLFATSGRLVRPLDAMTHRVKLTAFQHPWHPTARPQYPCGSIGSTTVEEKSHDGAGHELRRRSR